MSGLIAYHIPEIRVQAHRLYLSIGESLHTASLTCTVAKIEFALGRREETTHQQLIELTTLGELGVETTQLGRPDRQAEQATNVSTAACPLAKSALADEHYQQALTRAECALKASEWSEPLKKADACLILGRIYSAMLSDEQAIQAFGDDLHELEKTKHIGIRISTHLLFSNYLLSRGKTDAGQQELEKARLLSNSVLQSSDTISPFRAFSYVQ